ncbi:hypothetical protein CHU95_19990 [Niveispirillum lacus]|uniref:Uncharacterized protein n=1 Tax=Niveispirillum lacus TaxID=1981099 RepID=A0A255YRT6_9PROT|nr:hypothetical protein CHU95_19990 [Niveispirillum lacus]
MSGKAPESAMVSADTLSYLVAVAAFCQNSATPYREAWLRYAIRSGRPRAVAPPKAYCMSVMTVPPAVRNSRPATLTGTAVSVRAGSVVGVAGATVLWSKARRPDWLALAKLWLQGQAVPAAGG